MQGEFKNHYFTRKLIIFLIIISFAALFWSSAGLQKTLLDSTVFTSQYLEKYYLTGIFVFLMISTLSAVISPFSSVPLIPVVIVVWGDILTIFILLFGWLLGGIISYFLGSFTGYSLAEKIFSQEKAEQYKQQLSSRANLLTVFLFRLAAPTEIAGYVLGSIKYNFLKYFIVTTVVEIIFSILVVYSGEALMETNKIRFILFVFLALFLTSTSFYFFKKNKK